MGKQNVTNRLFRLRVFILCSDFESEYRWALYFRFADRVFVDYRGCGIGVARSARRSGAAIALVVPNAPTTSVPSVRSGWSGLNTARAVAKIGTAYPRMIDLATLAQTGLVLRLALRICATGWWRRHRTALRLNISLKRPDLLDLRASGEPVRARIAL